MATKSIKSSTSTKVSAPKVARARKSETVTSDAATETHPPRDAVAMRAYELWCARGFRHGHDVEDWLAAERELNAS